MSEVPLLSPEKYRGGLAADGRPAMNPAGWPEPAGAPKFATFVIFSQTSRRATAGVKNGRLLALAEQQFDVFLTGDRNVSFQQDIPQFRIAVVVLAAPTTQLKDTLPLMPTLLARLPLLQPGTITVLSQ